MQCVAGAAEPEFVDAKPLRSLAPCFPAPQSVNTFQQSNVPQLVCSTPVVPFPGGVLQPQFSSFAKQAIQAAVEANVRPVPPTAKAVSSGNGPSHVRPIRATPISAVKTPAALPDDDDDDDEDEDDEEVYTVSKTSSSGRKIKRPNNLSSYNVGPSAGAEDGRPNVKRPKPSFLRLAVNAKISLPPSAAGDPRETVKAVMMMFDALRRRHQQLDEVQETGKRADLKSGAIMMSSNLKANATKRVGVVPGVEIGDIYFFRMEMCVIGVHSLSMGGIDYMTAKARGEEDPLAICIVSAGGYENEDDDVNMLIYSGQGGSSDKDQKLERGNLALDRSYHLKKEIRVVRGAKDPSLPNGRIYIYDGLYKIQDSWKEKTKSGCSVFKYRLIREPGQPDGIAIWKMTQKWIDSPASRGKVALQDLSAGAEHLPVCVVNEVDDEVAPSQFAYATQVKHLKPIVGARRLQGCGCQSVCLPGDVQCSCTQGNGGDVPYSSMGLLVCRKPMVYECNDACRCSFNCRNRVTQKGIRFHFEVFRTAGRGWGLRCWDPIRAGMFICEYTGEVIDEVKVNLDDEDDDYVFRTVCPGEETLRWNYGPELIGEQSTYITSETFEPLPIKISAKRVGNVSRFMNHSCSPNVFWQPVQHDHGDDGHPHIMFFAMSHIPPMTELTYDYGVAGGAESSSGSGRVKKCLCGSPNCRGTFA